MAKGSGETKIAVSSAGGGSFRMSKKGKAQVGLAVTPNQAFVLTIALIAGTLVLHILGKFIAK
jgi:hypothetical protein